ncbi:MAG: VOC family protein [Ignavibacteriales bacterium]|nr:MAG: VOC family protein [Ignavibacteriales bacterium]
MIKVKYVHTNLIAEDWKSLSEFYINVFGCVLVPPERNYSGEGIEKGTSIKNVSVRGVHLRLPGWDNGPTLEIFSYSPSAERKDKPINRSGFGHIAFEVENVLDAQQKVLNSGGKKIGEIVTLSTSDDRKVTWCYVADPEDNVIELQSWSY